MVPDQWPWQVGRPVYAAALGAFLLTLLLAGSHNDFPFYYHADEPGKVRQIQAGERNYHHPPLMLDVVAATTHEPAGSPDLQRLARQGRWLSALYLALANALLVVLAGFYGGTLAAVLATVFVTGDSFGLEAGHYFKEDTLLVLGLAATALAGAMRRRWRREWLGPLVLGLAAGFAASTKYLGLLALPFVVVLEWTIDASSPRRARNLGILGLAATTALLACWQSALHAGGLGEVLDGFSEVAKAAREGNDSIGRRIPHARYLGLFLISTSPLMLLGWLGALEAGRAPRASVAGAPGFLVAARPARADSRDALILRFVGRALSSAGQFVFLMPRLCRPGLARAAGARLVAPRSIGRAPAASPRRSPC